MVRSAVFLPVVSSSFLSTMYMSLFWVSGRDAGVSRGSASFAHGKQT